MQRLYIHCLRRKDKSSGERREKKSVYLEDGLDAAIDRLRRDKPSVIIGGPEALVILVNYADLNRLVFNNGFFLLVCVSLDNITLPVRELERYFLSQANVRGVRIAYRLRNFGFLGPPVIAAGCYAQGRGTGSDWMSLWGEKAEAGASAKAALW